MDNTLGRISLMLLGIFMILLGVGTIMYPDYLVWTSGIGVILYGLGAIYHWVERSKMGIAKRTTLASAIFDVVVGVVILIGGNLGYIAVGIEIIILALWMIVVGVLEIVGAVIFRKAMTTADLGVQAPGSVTSMVLGVILILAGLFSLVEPFFAVIAAGIMIAVILIITGIRLVVSGIYSGILLRREIKS